MLIGSLLTRATVQVHLREQGYYEALNALALESNTTVGSLSSELLYLQKIVLQGR